MHKYTYVHGDPIGGVDPTGNFKILSLLAGIAISTTGFALVSASYQGYRAQSWDVFAREVRTGLLISGILLPFAGVYKIYRAARLARAANAGGRTVAVTTQLTVQTLNTTQRAAFQAFKSLFKELSEEAVEQTGLRVPYRWAGNVWQKQALEEYLEAIMMKYLAKHPDGITKVSGVILGGADDAINLGAGRISQSGKIFVSKTHGNLSTLTEELIHFA
ncbi:hypothetical protein [Novipirellula rosea]|uniref:Uncharacterized protein n=1 Tax=Novipirellula rosea TaxID=1031540 RepID=A0ABP8NEL5_9BACT